MKPTVEVLCRVPEPIELWKSDREMYAMQSPSFAADLTQVLPIEKDFRKINAMKGGQWSAAPNSITLDQATANALAQAARTCVETLFDHELDMPEVHVVPEQDVLRRMNDLEKNVVNTLGFGNISEHEQAISLHPVKGMILVPDVFVWHHMPTPYDKERKVAEWDKPYLEQAFIGALTGALIYQIRGEWGKAFISANKELRESGKNQVTKYINCVIQQAKEALVRKGQEQFALYVASEKVTTVWQNKAAMETYAGMAGLLTKKSFKQVACADGIDIFDMGRETYVTARFIGVHPNKEAKYAMFMDDKKPAPSPEAN